MEKFNAKNDSQCNQDTEQEFTAGDSHFTELSDKSFKISVEIVQSVKSFF